MVKRTKEEQKLVDDVVDRLQGGPRLRMEELARTMHMTYPKMMRELKNVAESTSKFGEWITLNFDTPEYDHDQMWADYELITGEVVPAANRGSAFSCSC